MKRSNTLKKHEATVVSRASVKQVRKHLRSIAGASDKGAASPEQSFELPAVGQQQDPAAPPVLSEDQAQGQVFGDKLVACAVSADASFADYVRQLPGKSVEFLTSCDGVVMRSIRNAKEQVEQDRDSRLAVVNADMSLSPADARKQRKAIEEEAARRKASVANGRLVQVRQIIAALTTSRTDIAFDWKSCKTFADFLSEAKQNRSGQKTKSYMTGSGHKTWLAKCARIVNLSDYDPESEKSQEQLGRLEKTMSTIMVQYLKVAEKIPTLQVRGEIVSKCLVEFQKKS